MPRTRLSPERRALVETMVPLAMAITRRYAIPRGLDARDLFSVAFEAMVDYAEDFDAAKGKASSYFGTRVVGALLDNARLEGRRRRLLPIEGFVPAEHPAPETGPGHEERRREVDRLLEATCEAPVLRMRYLEGMSLAATAKAFRVAPLTIGRRVRRGLERIRSFASHAS